MLSLSSSCTQRRMLALGASPTGGSQTVLSRNLESGLHRKEDRSSSRSRHHRGSVHVHTLRGYRIKFELSIRVCVSLVLRSTARTVVLSDDSSGAPGTGSAMAEAARSGWT